MNHSPLQSALLSWNEQGTPVSRQFDDVYFSNQDGLEETRHVFLTANGLPARFDHHARALFVVAETGFGTGLNVLALWQLFNDFRRRQPQATLQRLHIISFEKHPLSREDLALAQQRWPTLAPFAEALRAQWPMPIAGCHRLIFEQGAVTLDLWLGDVNETLPAVDSSLHGQVDAWFLDGFAPAKNPDMWRDVLFKAMARLARPDGSFATFTAAGFVRRGLIDAGFAAEKIKGFGRKREMLAGRRTGGDNLPPVAPWYARSAARHPAEVAIIGGGIASALTALALLRRGSRVTLYCADRQPATGASGNRQGALYPLLNERIDPLAQFFASAFGFARRHYHALSAQGLAFEHDWCGVTQLAWDDKSARKVGKILAAGWPAALVGPISRHQMAPLVGLETGSDGACYPAGGWLEPAGLTRAALSLACSRGLQVHYQHQVQDIAPVPGGWQLRLADGRRFSHATLVLANGHQLTDWPLTAPLPMYNVRGQVSHIPTTPALTGLKQVLCYDGYLTPLSPGHQTHCLGSSYQRGDQGTDYRAEEQQQNRDRLTSCLVQPAWTGDVDISGGQARCGVRSAVRDHMPLVGNVPDYARTLALYADLPAQLQAGKSVDSAPVWQDLFMLGGLGSRGLCSAPLAAEMLAGQIHGEPLPLSQAVSAALSPNRFWLRKLLKGRAVKAVTRPEQ